LKRELSNPQLQGLMTAKQQRTGVTVLAASSNGNGNGSGTAEPMALDAAVTTGDAGPSGAGVDVEAVAAKHGWDLQARNDWQGDRQVRWLPLASIRRPLARSRSNGEHTLCHFPVSVCSWCFLPSCSPCPHCSSQLGIGVTLIRFVQLPPFPFFPPWQTRRRWQHSCRASKTLDCRSPLMCWK
jgi:hypothetical protein